MAVVLNANPLTGTLTHESSVTITGTGFGTKSPAAPAVWDDFSGEAADNGPPDTTATIGTWSGVGDNSDMHMVGDAAYLYGCGTRAVHLDGTGNGRDLIYNYSTPNNGSIYMYCKRRYASVFEHEANAKHLYIYPASGTYPSPLATWHYEWGALNKNYVNAGVQTCDLSNPGYVEVTSTFPQPGVWETDEYIIKNNSAVDASDGEFRFDWNGTTLFDRTNVIFRSTAESGTMTIFHYSNYGAIVAMDLADHYFDITWSRVMICTGSTWAARGVSEIQIPTAWADGSVTVTVNMGAFTVDSVTRYLYVVDSAGLVNDSGYPVTFGTTYGDNSIYIPNPGDIRIIP